MPFSLVKSLVISLAALIPVQATWVVQCGGRLYDQRSDPIVQPGRVSHHVHVLCGGNGFNFSMTYDDARNSACSSCRIKEDMSAYWSPKLYYRGQDGSFSSVPIDGDDGKGNTGGMAIYYLHRNPNATQKIAPFPPGFRMVAGNPFKRTPGNDFNSQAVSHRCIGTDLETPGFPNVTCPGGVRMQVTFPGCWNGKDLDPPDHMSHVAYPIDGNYDGGNCPSTHPVHIMTLFFEVTYRTDLFQWWDNKTQPFILATGDPTGYGFHGDFLNGWDPTTLEKAINDCTDDNPDCPDQTFTYWTAAQQQHCKLPLSVNEDVNGKIPSLPGCNPPSFDMFTAIKNNKNCASKKTFNPSKDRLLPPINGWEYIGCGFDDNQNGLTFPDDKYVDSAMTNEKCVNYCDGKGYSYAGLEYSKECYCGNSLAADRAPWPGVWGNCILPCPGNLTQDCGGYAALTIYKKLNAGMKKTTNGMATSKARRFADRIADYMRSASE